MQLFPSHVQSVISRGLALKYTTASGHDICDIRAHDIMFAPQSPHFRLDLNMEQKLPPYGPCWSSTMFINKHMWIHHKTVILSLCIMRLKTSSSCLYGAHIYPSSCARFPDQFTLFRFNLNSGRDESFDKWNPMQYISPLTWYSRFQVQPQARFTTVHQHG